MCTCTNTLSENLKAHLILSTKPVNKDQIKSVVRQREGRRLCGSGNVRHGVAHSRGSADGILSFEFLMTRFQVHYRNT